ncbi:MAG: hypothetical protein ACYSU0_06400, partial [Planctomycetota bacterium]
MMAHPGATTMRACAQVGSGTYTATSTATAARNAAHTMPTAHPVPVSKTTYRLSISDAPSPEARSPPHSLDGTVDDSV